MSRVTSFLMGEGFVIAVRVGRGGSAVVVCCLPSWRGDGIT